MEFPELDAVRLIKNIRRNDVNSPILMLSESGAIDQRLAGLGEGADDYLIKPFKLADLAERMITLLRKRKQEATTILRFNALEINLSTRTVTVNGEEISLSTRPFSVLASLVRNVGNVVSREKLAREIWHDDRVTEKNVIEVQINHLRSIFSDLGHPLPMKTIRGEGYLLRNKSF